MEVMGLWLYLPSESTLRWFIAHFFSSTLWKWGAGIVRLTPHRNLSLNFSRRMFFNLLKGHYTDLDF